MWVHRRVVIASVLMMLISDSASKPQNIQGISDDDDEFFKQLGIVDKQGSVECKCVPFNKCCDPRDEVGDLYRTGNDVIDVNDSKITKCETLLEMCCENYSDVDCKERNTSEDTSQIGVSTTAQCGIRHPNGVLITLKGFQNNQAQFGEFPWMVAVLTQHGNEYIAGGSLVHPRVVLTAAHKVYGERRNLVARLGDWDLSASTAAEVVSSQVISVEKVLPHQQFDRSNSAYNVALLILKKEAKLGDTVMPICLPPFGHIFDGTECYVTGWGKDVFGEAGKFQKILKKVPVPAVSHSECQTQLRETRLGKKFNLHSTLNCAGGNGEDACDGDGGSPLVCPNPNSNNPDEYVQMGVVAWGIDCGVVGRPGVYGSIPQTVDWINQTIQSQVNSRG